MTDLELSIRIAQLVKEAGGRVFYVGGCVRDKLLHLENKDIDIEVHGVTPETLIELLKTIGNPISFGSSFGIFSIAGNHVDIAMPRTEVPTGKGHRDFTIDLNPFIGYKEAARRRDFTINALMEDVLSGEIVDSFGGLQDLENGIIRCVDPKTFVEDPLRVLRAAQFASRFGFDVDEATLALCKTIDLSALSRERVEEEMKKALIKSKKPSVFFEVLRKTDHLDGWFKEVKEMIGVPQDPIYHPEGDVYTHSMEVLDRAVLYQDKVSDPYHFALLALTHDFGKIITTQVIDGRIHSYRHEVEGLPKIHSFIRRLTSNRDIIRYLDNMVPLHMRPMSLAYEHASIKSTNRLFDQALYPQDLICMALADSGVSEDHERILFLKKRYEIFQDYMNRPYVDGNDLIKEGLKPDKDFSAILAHAHKLRLAGVKKDDALKQTLAYAGNLKKKED